MAKRKRKVSRLNVPKIATFLVVILALAGIGLTVFASQQRTKTQSEAACGAAPGLTYLGSDTGSKSITYKMRLTNKCASGWQIFGFKVSALPNSPYRYTNWKWRFSTPLGTGSWNTEFYREQYLQAGKSAPVYVTISRASISNIKSGSYTPIKVKAWKRGNSENGTFLNLPAYKVQAGSTSDVSGTTNQDTGSATDTACTTNPTITNLSSSRATSNGLYYFTYNIRVKNNCSGTNKYKLYVVGYPAMDGTNYSNWKMSAQSSWRTPLLYDIGTTKDFTVTVFPQKNYQSYSSARTTIFAELTSNPNVVGRITYNNY